MQSKYSLWYRGPEDEILPGLDELGKLDESDFRAGVPRFNEEFGEAKSHLGRDPVRTLQCAAAQAMAHGPLHW